MGLWAVRSRPFPVPLQGALGYVGAYRLGNTGRGKKGRVYDRNDRVEERMCVCVCGRGAALPSASPHFPGSFFSPGSRGPFYWPRLTAMKCYKFTALELVDVKVLQGQLFLFHYHPLLTSNVCLLHLRVHHFHTPKRSK